MSDFTITGHVAEANSAEKQTLSADVTRFVLCSGTIAGKSGYSLEFELRLPSVVSPSFDPLGAIALGEQITLDVTIGG